jgi:hypothetical protein
VLERECGQEVDDGGEIETKRKGRQLMNKERMKNESTVRRQNDENSEQ